MQTSSDAVAALHAAHARDAPAFAIKSDEKDGFCGVCTWRGHSVALDAPAASRTEAEQQLAELMLAAHGGGGDATHTLVGVATTCASRKGGALLARAPQRGGTLTLHGKLAVTARALGRSTALHIYAEPSSKDTTNT